MSVARHFLIAFVRNLQATKLLSAIAIAGLVIGIAGAILMGLLARSALTFNDFVADHDRVYLGISALSGPGMPAQYDETSNGGAAALIEANVPGASAARLAEAEVELRRSGRTVKANIYWSDPDLFDLLRVPVLHGRPDAALRRADGLVMTRSEAVRLFGRADALGETIDVAGRPMVLRAVIEDLPALRTDLQSGIFASGLAAQSALATWAPDSPGSFSIGIRTYVGLPQGVSAQSAERRMAPLMEGLLPPPMRGAYAMKLVRIDRLALDEGLNPEARSRLEIGTLVAGLILFIAVANFINLGVAISARRRREIGVRRANGASRFQIAAQFLGESVLTVLIATGIAASLVELLLPTFNAFLGTAVSVDYAGDPALLLSLALGAAALGLAAGAYPAFLLASLRPAVVLRERSGAGGGRGLLRGVLVTAQFSILVGLIIALAVIYQQRLFATNEALRADVDQLLTVSAPCPASFRQEAARLPGVRGVSCSGRELLTGDVFAFVAVGDERVATDMVTMLPGNFALYGIAPVAGSLAALPPEGQATIADIVINETAARRFGYASPERAIGQVVPVPQFQAGPEIRAEIVAVVPDFALYSVETAIKPTIYLDLPRIPGGPGLVTLRLAGQAVPETLDAIDRLWRETGNSAPIERAFVSDHVEQLYRGLVRGMQLFAIFAGLATFLACMGLLGLSISATERRTKEIGIRKVLGARTGQVLMLLLYRLSRPVLWANLIAWPIAWWLMQDWLNGFAYHVPLRLWLFPAAGLIALAVALASIGTQAFLVARQKPIAALRYE